MAAGDQMTHHYIGGKGKPARDTPPATHKRERWVPDQVMVENIIADWTPEQRRELAYSILGEWARAAWNKHARETIH